MNNYVYPSIRISILFVLFGGAIGGLLIGLSLILLVILEEIFISHDFNLNGFGEFIGIVFLSIFFGSVIGFLPALISALIIVKKRLNLSMQKIYKQLFIIGFLSTLIPVCLYMLLYGVYLIIEFYKTPELLSFMKKEYLSTNSLDNIFGTLIICTLSGIVTIILGKFVLPKGE